MHSLKAEVARRASTVVDRWHGTETTTVVSRSELDYGAEHVGYEPSRWFTLRIALSGLPIGREEVFLDLGCGKGRVLLEAARRYPFRRVVGVERSPELVEVARANHRCVVHRLRCSSVELVAADLTTWEPPEDITLAYMYSPVKGAAFASMLEQLLGAVDRMQRSVTLVYVNPVERAQLDACARAEELPPPSRLLMRVGGLPRHGIRRYELRPTDTAPA